jgi:hypothetical protein
MDFNAIFKQIGPMIVGLLTNVLKTWKTDAPTSVPQEPIPGPGPVQGPVPTPTPADKNAHESEAIKGLQKLLNAIPGIAPTPPLDEDGWLGPQTEAVILKAIEMAKSYGFG